ncbi:MAG: prepilin-type N-terminal cleavage/methylation domain-containing protein [Verrucomicrobiales bacterium]|jgi:type II secretion system protein H|nr:prepilin-type N-terminal cleavage/methylation domain-containing protein [Verrucomicrobiales bacterium]
MNKSAFTMIELLVVVAIMGILTAIAIPSLRGWRGSQTVNSAVITISGILNNARQEAITKNTYVYVALGNTRDNAGRDILWLVTFSPDDVTQCLDWQPEPALNLPVSGWQLTTAPRSFPNLLLKNSGELTPASLSDAAVDNPNINSLAEAAITVSVGARRTGVTLSRLFVFTPGGQAMSEAELNQYLEFGLVSAQDKTSPPKDPAVFRISGNLGIITVYRN